MMSITQTIQNRVDTFPAGQIFDYQDFPSFIKSPSAVIKAISRMVADDKIERFSKGQFYVPKKSMLGYFKPSDKELIKSELYKKGQLCGYITGQSLYNKLGLTTQIPRTITIAYNGGRQIKDFGTIRIKKIVTRVPIQKKDVELLQYLDVLKGIRKISASDVDQSLIIISRYFAKLSIAKQKRLLQLALKYYSPQVRALAGLLFVSLGFPVSQKIADSLNPVTVYKLNLDKSIWPKAFEWNIH